MTDPKLVDPSACAHCTVGKYEHAQRWSAAEGIGWHQYVAPSRELHAERFRAKRRLSRTPYPRTLPTPDSCRHCDEPERIHGNQWTPNVGLHLWEAPTQAQRLERMRQRRAERTERTSE